MAKELIVSATGRRKESIARVRMKPGSGEFVVNDRTLDEYFGRDTSKMILKQPLDVVEQAGKVDISITVCGGGVSGQGGAIRHGLRRALAKLNPGIRLPPMFRVDGSLVPLKDARRLPPEEISRMAFGIMNDYQKEKFKAQNELDLAYGVPGLGRFRVNVFQQRGTIGVVLRVIPFKISTIEQLVLPKVLEKVANEQRGLILVTGTTGSGKSTTLAAMVDYINTNETCHIMTIDDPIEFIIRDKRSIVNQREVGVDTLSFAQALKSTLRQDPDVILVGEMRDLE